MLLGALKAFHERQPDTLPPLYANAPLRYVIDLDTRGRPVTGRLTDNADPSDSRARRGRSYPLPQVVRSYGVKPFLLADKADYALGYGGEAAKPDRVAACHQAFVELAARCAAETQSADVAAVVTFVSGDPLKELGMPDGFDPGAVITFTVDGRFPIDDDVVRAFWASVHDPGSQGGPVMQCIVCGQRRPAVERLPGKIKGIPGGQMAGTSLVSANLPAFLSYGLEASRVSPICSPCAEGFTRGLNKLLADRTTSVRIDPAIFAFWTREPTAFSFRSTAIDGEPEAVRALMEAVTHGGRPGTPDANAFYGLTLTASGGRAVVRDWLDMSVDAVASNVATWFERQRVVDPWADAYHPLGLYALAMATVREARDLSPSTMPTLLRGAMTASALPTSLMHLALSRCRAEQGANRSRAALIKLVLLSHTREKGDTIVGLQEDNPNAAYQCGRLLAVLESAQRAALGDVGAGVVDRFYGSASSAPLMVFPRLLKGAQPHLGKLQRDRPGVWMALQGRITDVVARIDSFPRVLMIEDQGLFALGYYHQRADDQQRRKDAKERKSQERSSGIADSE